MSMNGPRNYNGPQGAKVNDDLKQDKARKIQCYKLIVDPALHKGQKKLYRIDGVIPGDPTSNVIVTDPRSRVARLLTKSRQADLLIPQFKVDEFYVGIPPPREVTFINVNDNINSDFLRNMVKDLGRIDECSICYNPQNGKHLGIAKVVFETTKSAKNCVAKFDQTKKMGNTMTVFTDPLGKERQGYIDERVYGIPRRHADGLSGLVPKPEMYVGTQDSMHTPHIPHSSQDMYADEFAQDGYHQEGYAYGEYDHSGYPPNGYEEHPRAYEGREYERTEYQGYDSTHVENVSYHGTPAAKGDALRGNGYRDYGDRDRRRDYVGDDSRGQYDDSTSRHPPEHRLRVSDHNLEGREHHQNMSYDESRPSGIETRESQDSRYNHRHQDSEHLREGTSHYLSERGVGETQPAAISSEMNDNMESETPVSSADESTNQPPTPPEPETDPGSLDLDARIKLMLNMNKDLAGFGAPEPVTAPPADPAPPPVSMLLEPQLPPSGTYPPMDPGYSGGGHPPPIPPHATPLYHVHHTPGPPPPPPPLGGAAISHVNMAPPPPPGWQPYNPHFHPLDGPPYPEYDHYHGDEQYNEFEEEQEAPIDYAETFELALEDLIENLKTVLYKDLCKRIVTQSAFKFFENWWQTEETKSKNQFNKLAEMMNAESKVETVKAAASSSADADSQPAATAPASTTPFSSLFESSTIFGAGSFLGAGLPKMPSFRKKISPTRELELQREREKEKAKDAEESPAKDKQPATGKRRRGSVSSGELSDSSSASSSESSSESEDESSASETDQESARKSKKAVVSSSEAESCSSSSSESESESESGSEASDSEVESAKEEKPVKAASRRKPPPKKQAPTKSKLLISESSAEETESTPSAEALPSSPGVSTVPDEEKVEGESAEHQSPALLSSPVKSARKRKALEQTAESIQEAVSQKDRGVDMETEELSLAALTAGDNETEDAVAALEKSEGMIVDAEKVSEEKEMQHFLKKWLLEEHSYTRPASEAPEPKKTTKRTKKQLQDITEKVSAKGNRELARLLKDIPDEKPKPGAVPVKDTVPATVETAPAKFKVRSNMEQRAILYELFNSGMDLEDMKYFKLCYEKMLNNDDASYEWCNDTHWVDHCVSNIPDPALPPPNKRSRKSSHLDLDLNMKRHRTGSARTEGYYKISSYEKSHYMSNARQYAQISLATTNSSGEHKVSAQSIQREARSNQRRLATAFGDLDTGELLKFNQLKFRNKTLRFSKSTIHDWGLYACEPIPIDTMVIEYVGAILRHSIADEREKQYERTGIGSSYLFRIDGETVIDATKCGNLARFVNHSCDPNCYARVITVDGAKKIVIYSRRKIEIDEEITYDYKFPYEDEKIPCLCGTAVCRGFLN